MNAMTVWHLYELPPVDYWEGMPSLNEYARVRTAERGNTLAADEAHASWQEAQAVATEHPQCAWEGDVADGPYVIVMPPTTDHGAAEIVGFMWKQGNNGLVYLAALVPFPHLDDGKIGEVKSGMEATVYIPPLGGGVVP